MVQGAYQTGLPVIHGNNTRTEWYKISRKIPLNSSSLAIKFFGQGLSGITDEESWSIDNLEVSIRNVSQNYNNLFTNQRNHFVHHSSAKYYLPLTQ